MNTYERMNYLEDAHHIVDNYETDVTHDQVDGWDDYDLKEWVDMWRESDDDDDEEGEDHP